MILFITLWFLLSVFPFIWKLSALHVQKTLISTADAQTQRECYPHPMFSVLLLIIERKVSKNNKMLIANKILSAAKHRRSLSN